MKYVLILRGGVYDEDNWERCVGVYDTEESANQAQVMLQEILNNRQERHNGDATRCYVEKVEENPDINSIELE